MIERIQKIQQEVEAYVFDENQKAESFRLAYLSKKGLITNLFDEFKS
jgi:phenylalanyl-tRNA synthetase alpha chain